MDVPHLFQTLISGFCSDMAPQLRYFMGHDHCNAPTADGHGFLVGGTGAAHGNCNEWGFVHIDTRGAPAVGLQEVPRVANQAAGHLVTKFTVATDDNDNFPDLYACVASRGSLSSCVTPNGEVWLNDTAGTRL